MHAPIWIVDATKIDENEDNKVVVCIDKYITCALPDETKYPETRNLVKIVQIHNYAITSRKKKGVTWRSNAPRAPSDQIRTVHFDYKIDETIAKQSKNYFITISLYFYNKSSV